MRRSLVVLIFSNFTSKGSLEGGFIPRLEIWWLLCNEFFSVKNLVTLKVTIGFAKINKSSYEHWMLNIEKNLYTHNQFHIFFTILDVYLCTITKFSNISL